MNRKKIGAIVAFSCAIFIFFACNGMTVLKNVATSTLNYLETTFFNVEKEIKEVNFESGGYSQNNPGEYAVVKSADWVDVDSALIEFEVTTNAKTNGKKKDVIFVVDTSGSMIGAKYERLEEDATELITKLLIDPENTVSLITFDSDVEILKTYSNNPDEIIDLIGTATIYGATDYYLALTAVYEVLTTYEKKEDRDCVVVFLTDGFPTQGNTNQLAEFQIINEKYPYVKIHGIQYEMGIDITEELKEVSHKQYSINMDTLRNVLFEAALESTPYDEFELIDYINNDYFYVESESDIEASYGTVSLVDENGQQKVVWNVAANDFLSGSRANLKIKVKLKDEYLNVGGFYPTNKNVDVNAEIEGTEINVESPLTPVLKRKYEVLYDMNTPTGCSLESFNGGAYSAFESVALTTTIPNCNGYTFLGWETEKEITYINDDYFIMPTEDITFRAIWSTFNIDKNMDGQVYEVLKLYDVIKKDAVLDNISSKYVQNLNGIDFYESSSDTNGKGVYIMSDTLLDEYPVYYYRGDVDNNVLFAGYCWKIIRTTETGGIKMIYNGLPSDEGYCNNTGTATEIKKSTYINVRNATSISYVGYMYNSIMSISYVTYSTQPTDNLFGNSFTYDSTTGTYTLVDTKTFDELYNSDTDLASHHYTCFNTTGTCTTLNFAYTIYSDYIYHVKLTGGKDITDLLDTWVVGNNTNINAKDSTVKTEVDNWYASNMTDYTQYLENTVYCNDRSINDFGGFDPNGTISLKNRLLAFAAYDRIIKGEPTLDCNLNDSFTLSVDNGGTAGYGNNALKYPVGLITADEVMYAGATSNDASKDYYLYTGQMYWPSTPYRWNPNNRASVYIVYGDYLVGTSDYSGSINGGYAYASAGYGVRPVISLKHDTKYTIGDGTTNNPYQVLLSE